MADVVIDLGNGLTSISFELGVEPLMFRDSIVVPNEVYAALTPADIEEEKQMRYTTWLNLVGGV